MHPQFRKPPAHKRLVFYQRDKLGWRAYPLGAAEPVVTRSYIRTTEAPGRNSPRDPGSVGTRLAGREAKIGAGSSFSQRQKDTGDF